MERLADKFDSVHADCGFISLKEPPLERLDDPYYSEWERILRLLPDLLMTCRVRSYIDQHFPELPLKDETKRDRRQLGRIFLITSFISHAYVRGGFRELTIDTLPAKLARPFKESARLLGFTPVVNYSATVIFNWALIEPSEPPSLDNLRCLNTITGAPDESWFYIVAVAMELKGASILGTILEMQSSVEADDGSALIGQLGHFATLIHELEAILERMYENCLPQSFYKRVRPYLSGWTNDQSLPTGLHYGPGSPGEKYSGASAAQSPLIQAIDVSLGILHPTHEHDKHDEETAKKSRVGLPGAYLLEMRKYMLKGHRECLEYLEEIIRIRSYVQSHPELQEAYNGALMALESFRTCHIKIVSYYIVSQAAREQQEIQGTGGSNPIPFLKDIREHVEHSKLT